MREVFKKITLNGREIMAVEPRSQYQPLFATILMDQIVGNRESNPTSTLDNQLLLPSRIAVVGIGPWVDRLSAVA